MSKQCVKRVPDSLERQAFRRLMKAVPIELKEANAFIDQLHRHHSPVCRDKFRVGCEKDGKLVGVVQVGRPLARKLCDGKTLEVLRLCSNGDRNVCSFLYSRAARIAKELGYEKIITYILESEGGTSLKASGWYLEADNVGGGTWSTPSRPREDAVQLSLFSERESKYPVQKKQRWAKNL